MLTLAIENNAEAAAAFGIDELPALDSQVRLPCAAPTVPHHWKPWAAS